ncbi:MAG: hypothetical protein ABEI99_03960 [Halobaculum sp.]
MSNQKGTLPWQIVRWYRHQLAIVTMLGAIVFLLVAFRIGPTEIVISIGLSLTVVFLLFFGSLLVGSDLLYRYITGE